MKRASALLGAALLAALATLAAASPASAHHNEVIADVTVEDCTLTGTTSWSLPEGENDHRVGNTELVVLVDGAVHHAVVGTPIDVDLPAGTTEMKWRVWGGGERDYDSPALDDLDGLVDYLKTDGATPLDPEAPGVAWHTVEVDSCPEPEPEPSDSTTVETTTTAATTTTTTTTEAAKLPNTGANLTTVLSIGGLLVLVGAGALILARRRRA